MEKKHQSVYAKKQQEGKMTLTKLEKWEQKLEEMLDEIDDILEDRYGNRYRLHPVRAARGTTSSKSQDGLINITANFSLGIGSEKGRGYIIKIRLSTLEQVNKQVYLQIEKIVIAEIRVRMKKFFPYRELKIVKDGNVVKIFGDLSLDSI